MYRVAVLYESEPDADSYVEHAELCARVPGGVFRHGRVTGSPMGEPAHAYYAEFEFADKQAFDEFVRSDQFRGAGGDVMERGWKLSAVEFAELA